ncbi:MAG: hypothetical protein EXS17_01345 [Phycisphaerales bacterium]|nr:hypothetical protein [Phycisphaerales bacterium]
MRCCLTIILRFCGVGAVILAAQTVLAAHAVAQESAIVAVDDSPTAQQLLSQAEDQSANNPAESARLISRVLDEFGRKLVRAHGQTDIFVDGRTRAEEFLRTHPRVLERFRSSQTGEAERLDKAREDRLLLETRLLTPAGLRCAMRQVQRAIESAEFAQAQRILDSIADHPDRAEIDPALRATATALTAWGIGDAAAAAAVVNELNRSSDPALVQLSALLAATVRTPIAASQPIANPLLPAEFGEIPAQPVLLWSEPLEQALAPRLAQSIDEGLISAVGSEGATTSGRLLVSIPTIDGALVLVNEGYVLRAYEAYSHLPRWYQLLGAPNAPRNDLLAGDLEVVVVSGDRVLALSGHALGSERSGGGRLVCLDLHTGKRLWEVMPDRFSEVSEFREMFFYGAPTVVRNTVILLGRKVTARLETVSTVIGINLDTGAIEWMTPVGAAPGIRSAGARPYTTPAVDGGIIFVSTGAGTSAALDAIDGRVRWIRRDPVPIRDVQLELMPWEMGGAIVTPRGVITLAPGGTQIQLLSIDHGAELDAIPVGAGTAWGIVRYLLTDKTHDLIFAVGEGITAFRASDLRTPIWKFVGVPSDDSIVSLVGRAGMRGRVQSGSTSDGRPALIVALLSRALLLNGSDGTIVSSIPCEGPANIVAHNGIIAAATNGSLEVFMDSQRARQILVDAVQSQSSDVDAAIGLIAFALQSQDAALLQTATASAAQNFAEVRDDTDRRWRLVELLMRAATSGLLGRDAADAIFGLIVTALSDPSERAGALIAQGDWFAKSGRATQAIASWRAVLKNAAVAHATVSRLTVGGGDLRQSGSDAAYQRLRQLARTADAPSQATQTDQVAPSNPTASQLEEFASQNPCTPEGARAWHAAAELRMAEQRIAHGAGDAAAAVQTAIATGNRALVTEVLDRTLTLLHPAGLEVTKSQLCDLAVMAGFDVTLASAGGLTASQTLAASPAATLVAGLSRPVAAEAGHDPKESVTAQLLHGVLTPMRDVGASLAANTRTYIVADKHLKCLSTPKLTVQWTIALLGEMRLIIPLREGVIVIDQRDSEMLGAEWIDDDGDRRWRIDDLAAAVPALAGVGLPSDCFVLGGRESLVVARHDGAVRAFGVGDGLPRWEPRQPLDEIVCADASETLIAVSGTRSVLDARTSWLSALDVRTGAVIAEIPTPSDEPVRWIQILGAGEVAFGTTRGVGRWQLYGVAAGLRWHSLNPRLRGSVRCESLGLHLVVTDPTDRTTILDWGTGTIDDSKFAPLRPKLTVDGSRRWIRSGSTVLGWSNSEVDLFSLRGEALGTSSLHGTRRLQNVLPASGAIVAIEQSEKANEPREFGLNRAAIQHFVHRFGWADGGRIAAPALEVEFSDPRLDRTQLLDGWLLLGGSQTTLAIPLP